MPSATFRIRSLTVGGTTIENVIGSIAPVSGTLLLGQSFLNRFNSWSFDNTKQALILQPRSDTAVNRADRTTSTASEFYHSRYLLTGFLLRAAAVCEDDSKRTIDAGFRLLDDPELKAISKAYSQTVGRWMEEGASNFNDGVMTDGVRKACALALEVRNKIEGSSSQQDRPSEQSALEPSDSVAGRAERFVLQVEERWSKGGAPDPIWLSSLYGDNIDYYGKRLPRQSVVAEKRAFGEKWHERAYTIPSGSMTASCNSATCVVKALIYFYARSQIKRMTSRGIATLSLALISEGDTFVIIGEAGNVLQRQQSRDDGTASTTIEAARQQWMKVPSQDKEQLEDYVGQHVDQCPQADPFAFTVTCYRRALKSLHAKATYLLQRVVR